MKTQRILALFMVLLLLLVGISAIFGGANLMAHPDGSSLQLDPLWLKNTPFHNYRVPGIILFFTNGVLPIAILGGMVTGYRNYPAWISVQGILLSGWILVQVVLIRTIIGLHLFLFVAGMAMVAGGLLMAKVKRAQPEEPERP